MKEQKDLCGNKRKKSSKTMPALVEYCLGLPGVGKTKQTAMRRWPKVGVPERFSSPELYAGKKQSKIEIAKQNPKVMNRILCSSSWNCEAASHHYHTGTV